MKSLIVNNLFIFSPMDKKAKAIDFSAGINIVTSSKQDGNKKGKSIILKSVFHALGADCYFDDKWQDISKVYVLKFTYDSDANSMLAELKGISVSLDSEIKKLNAHQCPYCSSYLEDATEKRIISYSNAEDVQLLSLDLQAQVLDLEQKIKKLEDEYIEISAKLKEFEAKIDAETREVSDVLRAKNMRELLDKFKLEYGDISKQLVKELFEMWL